ncbi:putative RNA-binding protein EIF1AD, partial [Lecanoromycetidae sp. Uapishka_2]
MGRPKRHLLATAEETSTPPVALADGQAIARVVKAEGNNLYSVELPSEKELLLVELPSRFRSQIWIKRGGYVVVDMSAFDDRENKLGGEIVSVVRDEKRWRKQSYWPSNFVKKPTYLEDSDDEESIVGKMPPAEESESGE